MQSKPTENELVARIADAMRTSGVPSLALGIGDDAALWHPASGFETILTCDWFLEGSHFLRDRHPADSVGWKCLARAVSDIAAMGGRPRCFLLSLALPLNLPPHWLNEFLRGLRRASSAFGCALAGGDTTRRSEILIHLTIIGEVKKGKALRRSGARPGDLIYVSGRLGEAEAGLRDLRKRSGLAKPLTHELRKHLYPQPRLALGEWLSAHRVATSMMDLSDGLSSDLTRLCNASGVGAEIDAAILPVVKHLERREALQLALHGGDDYELLFAVPARRAMSLPRRIAGVPITQIGRITRERKIVLIGTNGSSTKLIPGGWDPFRS